MLHYLHLAHISLFGFISRKDEFLAFAKNMCDKHSDRGENVTNSLVPFTFSLHPPLSAMYTTTCVFYCILNVLLFFSLAFIVFTYQNCNANKRIPWLLDATAAAAVSITSKTSTHSFCRSLMCLYLALAIVVHFNIRL